jgi:hypothetical protein
MMPLRNFKLTSRQPTNNNQVNGKKRPIRNEEWGRMLNEKKNAQRITRVPRAARRIQQEDLLPIDEDFGALVHAVVRVRWGLAGDEIMHVNH